MGPNHRNTFIELQRTQSSFVHVNKLLNPPEVKSSFNLFRQHYDSGQRKLHGLKTHPPLTVSQADMDNRNSKSDKPSGEAHQRNPQPGVRSAQPSTSKIRMDSSPGYIQLHRQEIRQTYNRPVRVVEHLPGRKIQQQVLRPTFQWLQCTGAKRLASTQQLRQPTIPTATRHTSTDHPSKGKSNRNRSLVACNDVVQNARKTINDTPNQTPTTQPHLFSSAKHHTGTMPKHQMETLRLEDRWRQTLLNKQWSEECAGIFHKFIATSTLRQYNFYIAQFQKFCFSINCKFPPDDTQISAVIAEFLLFKAKQSERPESLLRSIRAALTHYFNSIGYPQPFCLFLKNFNTALVKSVTSKPAGRTSIMPLKPFIDMFNEWPQNENLSVTDLRLKAVTLLTISSLAQCSDIAPTNTLKRNQIKFNQDGSLTLNYFGIKNDSDRKGFTIRVEPSANEKCDPVRTIKDYMNRTELPLDSAIFVKAIAPYEPITARGISDILRTAIKRAGLGDTYTPRCFRPSAASAAIQAGCDHETIRALGRWKGREVFYNHYVYPLPKKDTTDKILSSDLQIY